MARLIAWCFRAFRALPWRLSLQLLLILLLLLLQLLLLQLLLLRLLPLPLRLRLRLPLPLRLPLRMRLRLRVHKNSTTGLLPESSGECFQICFYTELLGFFAGIIPNPPALGSRFE